MTAAAAPTVSPRDWRAEPADVLLADGTIAVIRSVREDDRDAVLGLHESVSTDTLRLRFFSPSRESGRRYVDHLFAPDNMGRPRSWRSSAAGSPAWPPASCSPPTGPRSRSWSPTRTAAGDWAASSSSTSPPSAGTTG